jgi:hypothetical protein
MILGVSQAGSQSVSVGPCDDDDDGSSLCTLLALEYVCSLQLTTLPHPCHTACDPQTFLTVLGLLTEGGRERGKEGGGQKGWQICSKICTLQ